MLNFNAANRIHLKATPMPELARTLTKINELAAQFNGHFSLKNSAGQYFFMNESMVRTIGRPAEELIGKTAEEIFPPHVASFVNDTDRLAYENEIHEYENVNQLNNEGHVYITVKVLVKDQTGKPLWLCTFACDEKNRDELAALREKLVNTLLKKA